MDYLLQFLNDFVTILKNIAQWLLDGILSVLDSVFYGIFDILLTTVTTIISTIDVTGLALNYASMWGLLPGPLVWFIQAVGLSTGLSMMGAYGIRFVLNLIPASITRV